MSYKLIAVDLDGTLLNDEKQISKKNIEYISKAIEKGVKFVLCSGRVPYALRFYADKIPANQPLICCNGCVVVNENKDIIFEKGISKENAIKVIKILNEKNTPYHFYNGKALCTESLERATSFIKYFNSRVEKKYQMETRILPDAIDFVNKNCSVLDKIVVVDNDLENLSRIRLKIQSELPLEVTKSEKNNLEIMESGTGKGLGLKILADYYNIKIEECIAIGNDENDNSMIELAGLGVAVSNANEKTKSIANYTTKMDNNNDAIAEVIEKFIL